MQPPTERPAKDIRVILFDLGGVLVELTGIPTLHSWTRNRMTTEELWVTWLSSPAVRAFETGRSSPVEFARALIGEMNLPLTTDEFLADFALWPRNLFPGAIDLVRCIPCDYTRAVLSNSNAMHWPRLMDEWGLGDVFDHQFGSHLIGKIKPDEEAFHHVIDKLDCDPAAIFFLDDNTLNIEAAQRVGMRAVQVKGVIDAHRALSEAGLLPLG
jgi:glucose-1-phosphatase